MNDEEITKYSDEISHYRSPTLAKQTVQNDEPYTEKSPKKEKKWSLGGLFRRKKKEVDSESTSDDETPQKRGFLQRRRHKKDEKRKRKASKTLGTFDHVVLTSNVGTNGSRPITDYEDIDGILSDPNLRITDQDYPKVTNYHSKTSLNNANYELNNSRNSLQNSLDSLGKRSRREKVKARVEALRDQMKNNSSSDEGSQQSNASSANKFRSDESLTKSQNGSLSRKSRSARTERYIKRLTKEEEIVLNKEAEQEKHKINNENKIMYNRWNVVDVPSVPQHISRTVPASHNIHRAYSNVSDNQRNQNIYQNITKRESQLYQNSQQLDHRSFSYDCNINRSPTPQQNEIIHIQFPLGKPVPKPRTPHMISQLPNHYSSSSSLPKSPPPPPPRDPQRKVFPTHQYEGNRPISYAFENGTQRIPRINSYQYNQKGLQPNRSNSEDHIGQANYMNLQNRPASATPDMKQQRYIKRQEQYQYFADKTPRSRKPIHIASPVPNESYLSDSQMLQKAVVPKPVNSAEFWKQKDMVDGVVPKPVTSASEFWRQKDMEEIRRKSQALDSVDKKAIKIPTKNEVARSSSQLEMSYPTQVTKNVTRDVIRRDAPLPPLRGSSRHSSGSSVDDDHKRRSTNLEEALDELEAIYKSLRLGDEDLLDRAERREVSAAAQQNFTKWNKETLSDSGFNYDVVDGLPKKREFKKLPNKLNDDMAYRRFYKDKTVSESPVLGSYLLTSPLEGDDASDKISATMGEPDITLDDMVYRNLKHVNNTLKISETQLPFGIPVGPITPAPNSDYLHAVPETHHRSRFVPQKSPDIVKDDLAYRALRKDNSKDPSLPHLNPEDYINNNTQRENPTKKRAVRSMSANIFNIMQQNYDEENEFDKSQSLTDIADAMEIAHKILREHNSKIFSKMNFDTKVKPSNNNTPTSTETLTQSQSNLEEVLNQKLQEERCSRNQSTSLRSSPRLSEDSSYRALERNSRKRSTSLRPSPGLAEDSLDKSQLELNCKTPERNSRKQPTSICSSPGIQDNSLDKSQEVPPIYRAPERNTRKQSTPLCSSPELQENSLDKSQLEELLTALAIEARETSEKLGNDLRLLDEETKKLSGNATPNFPTEEKLKDIEKVSEHAKLCEKLLECVVESTEIIAPKAMEEANDFMEPCYKSVANIIVTRNADFPVSETRPEVYSESDHDYDNITNIKIKIKEEIKEEEVKEEDKLTRNDLPISEVNSGSNYDNIKIKTEVKKKIKEEKVKEEEDSDEKTLIDETPKCVTVPSCCKSQKKEGKSTNEILNDLLLTKNLSKIDEFSSGFHTDSNGSSPDFSLESVNSRTNFDLQINFNNEFCTHVEQYNPESHSLEFSSIGSMENNSIFKDTIEPVEYEPEFSSFVNLNETIEKELLVENKEETSKNILINSLCKEENSNSTNGETNIKYDIPIKKSNFKESNSTFKDILETQENEPEFSSFVDLNEEQTDNTENTIINPLNKNNVPNLIDVKKNSFEEDVFDSNNILVSEVVDNSFVKDNLADKEFRNLEKSTLSEETKRLSEKLNQPSTSFYFSDSSLSSTDEDEPIKKSYSLAVKAKLDKISQHSETNSDSDKKSAWYQNPTNLILACSYAVACAHQLAILDVVTLLGIILAIISVFAAFIL